MNPLGTGDPLRLGPYRLTGVLGEGGMGKVYVGQDATGTLAAVKVLKPQLAHDTHLAQRFVREAQAAQAVHSAGVAAVLGAWTEGGRPWIATEFLAGLTLDQAVDTFGPLPEPAVRALAASLARTLVDIHAAGFVHRDLKPPNIVLTSTGPRIIDFGIARPEHGLTLTTTGQVPVTPGYGAPEQVLGQRVAPPADVFSLGAVLVYAATGRRAFDGGHVAAVQYAVVHDEPQLTGLSPALAGLVAPCLAKSPDLRPVPAQIASAMAPPKGAEQAWRRGAFADAIKERERGARQLTTQVTGVPGAEPVPSVSRRRLLTGLAAGGVVVAAGGGAGAWWLAGRGSDGAAESPVSSDPFDIPPAVSTPEEALDKNIGGTSVTVGRPSVIWNLDDEADTYSPTLLTVRDVLVLGAASGGIAAYDVRTGKRRWHAPRIRPRASYVSLSDRLVAAADEKGTLYTYVASTGVAKWTCPAAEAETVLAADEDAVYCVTKIGRVRAVGRADAKVRWTIKAPAEFRKQGLMLTASAARGRLVLVTANGKVLVLDTRDGSVAWTRPSTTDVSVTPAVDGDTVYINGPTLEARRLSDGEVVWTAKIKEPKYEGENWGPPTVADGAVYVCGGNYPRRLDTRDGSEMWRGYWVADENWPVLHQGHGAWSLDSTSSITSQKRLNVNTLRSSDGERAWRYQLPHADHQNLVADGNRVFVMADSAIYAFTVF
ncbi:PQQ-binding-like beta-propeller repeat protein [Streptomyces sp. SID8379]|uniref:serine/threonine-protein kinase n=1 Tax=unclassified Streptomyces TaxID=2593676 RepID=UPI00037B5315|nr:MULTISPECIES: serine/threonine-protein kinase [unclassified Streptomyces]MYW69563.1 PQQ-binding-like beta-propeller repeat protein [Streptomyces sp. SID8379]